jgi:predicted nucleic acid-binding protein
MGKVGALLARLAGERVYIDSNIFVYFLERHPLFFPVVAPVFAAIQAGSVTGLTGDAVVAEVMVGPYRSGSPAVIADVKSFFNTSGSFIILRHGPDEFDLAAQLRASHGMKFADALHVATASRAACRAMLTNDDGIRPAGAMEIVGLRQLMA